MVNVAQIKSTYNSMNTSQQKDFLKTLGISDINGVNMVNLFAAENYFKSHGITGLGDVSLFNKPKNVSDEIANEANAKYKKADEKWNNWHAILNFANAQESYFKDNAKTFLTKAKNSAAAKGIDVEKSDDYKKYVTYTNSASDAYSLFKQALSGEQMAVSDKKAANKLSTISMFYQG